MKFSLLVFFSLVVFSVHAQSLKTIANDFEFSCGYVDGTSNTPANIANRKQLGQLLTQSNPDVVYQIPIVVHVIYSSECEELSDVRYKYYPSDKLIRFEIEQASQRFRHAYPGARIYENPYYGIDTKIELKFATIDPGGAFTTGINRIVIPQAENKSAFQFVTILDKYKWDTRKYCNIFIVKGMNDASGVYFLDSDLTIYSTSTFWSGLINHELGHYLGLAHIFETGYTSGCPSNTDCTTNGDGICDTPPKYTPGNADMFCKGDIINSCSSDEADVSGNNPYRPVALGGMGDQPDMITNYMDYTGNCWDAFTAGQRDKMRSGMKTRSEMIDFSAVAFTNSPPAYYLDLKNTKLVQSGCTDTYTPVIEVENKGSSSIQSLTITLMDGTTVFSQLSWTGNLNSGEIAKINFSDFVLARKLYVLKVLFENPNNQPVEIYQPGACRKFDFNYDPTASLRIPFTACKDFELGTITNDINLNWAAFRFDMYMPGKDCRQCVARLMNKNSDPQTIQHASFELQPRDFTSFNNPQLRFLMGCLPDKNTSVSDVLSVKIAADCESYETVWEAAGMDLATSDRKDYQDQEGFYYSASCDQYKDFNIDLVKYAGKKDVRIRVEAKGKFLPELYIDDILIEDGPPLPPSPLGIGAGISKAVFHFTNPVLDQLIIHTVYEFDLYQIVNLNGDIIIQTNSKQINVSQLKPGLYFLTAQNSNQSVVEKLIKQ